MKLKNLTIITVLSAFSLIIYVLESEIPPIVPIPGVKLGLANVITLFAMSTIGVYNAFIVLMIKIFLGSLFTGTVVSFAYSFFGGMFCFIAEWLMHKIVSHEQLWAISITGAIFHNIGQIAVATVLLGTEKIIWYLAVLIPVAIITGAFTGVCTSYTLKAVEKTNLLR